MIPQPVRLVVDIAGFGHVEEVSPEQHAKSVAEMVHRTLAVALDVRHDSEDIKVTTLSEELAHRDKCNGRLLAENEKFSLEIEDMVEKCEEWKKSHGDKSVRLLDKQRVIMAQQSELLELRTQVDNLKGRTSLKAWEAAILKIISERIDSEVQDRTDDSWCYD